MLDSWIVGYGIEYSDGGAPQKLETLAKASDLAGKSFAKLTANAKAATAAIFDLGEAAAKAAAGMSAAGAAGAGAASGATRAASAARAAASAYREAASAAGSYAAAVYRANAVVLEARTGAPLVGGGRSWRNVGGLADAQMALPGGRAYALAGGGLSGARRDEIALGGGANYIPPGGAGIPPGDGRGGFGHSWFSGAAGAGGGGGRRPPVGGDGWSFPMPPRGSDPASTALSMVPGPWSKIGAAALKFGKYAGVGVAGLSWDAVHEAGQLQSILTSIYNVGNVNPKSAEAQKIQGALYSTGHMSGTSVSESGKMFREIVRNAVGSMSMDDMLSLLPQTAKLQVVLGATRGFSPEQTVDNTMALVHLFRQYDAKGTPAMMDTIVRMGELMPSNLNKAVTQMGYFMPTLKNLHVSDQDAASLMVAISRFGGTRGRGGTSVADLAAQALGPLQLTQHVQSAKSKLLGPGMLNVLDAKGNSRYFTDKGGNIFGFLEQLADFEKKHGSVTSQRVFQSAFGVQGNRIASMMADPILITQLEKIRSAIENQKSLTVGSQANTLFGTAKFAEQQAWSDFQSLMTEIGTQSLPAVTYAFKGLDAELHGAQVWLHQHKTEEHAFMNALTSDVHLLGATIAGNKADFVGLGLDLVRVGNAVNDITRDAILAVGPLAKIARVLADIATLRFFDEFRDFNEKTRTKQNAQARQAAGGTLQLPGQHAHGKAPRPGAIPDANNAAAYRALFGGNHTRERTREVHLVVDHRNGNALTEAVVNQHVHKALHKLVNEKTDPRHIAGKSGSIVTSPRQPTRNTTPTNPGG